MPKFLAHGCSLTYNSIDIGNIRNISGPDASKEEVDITDHDSTAGSREFVPGLKDFGTLTLECNYNPNNAGQQAMVTDFVATSNTTRECVLTLPAVASSSGTVTLTFDAFVLNTPIELPGTEAAPATRTFTLRLTGVVTEAIA